MHTIAMRITGCVALMVMGGCGGGGGGDDDAPPPAEPVVIDQSNAMEVTASVLGPVTLIRELGTAPISGFRLSFELSRWSPRT